MDHLGFVQPVDGFSQGLIVGVAHAAHRRLDAGFASPEDIGPHSLFRTALTALHCALDARDWRIVAKAFVMLEDAAARTRTEYLTEVAHFRGWRPESRMVPPVLTA